MLRELSKVIQVILQGVMDAPDLHLHVEVHEDITQPHHLHQRLGEGKRENPCVAQEFYGVLRRSGRTERQSCDQVMTYVNDALNRKLQPVLNHPCQTNIAADFFQRPLSIALQLPDIALQQLQTLVYHIAIERHVLLFLYWFWISTGLPNVPDLRRSTIASVKRWRSGAVSS